MHRSFIVFSLGFISLLTGCSQELAGAGSPTTAPVADVRIDCDSSDVEFFSNEVWPILQECSGCHVEGGVAANQGARFTVAPGNAAASQTLLRDYIALAGDRLVNKPTLYQVSHGGGHLFSTSSPEAATLAEAVLRYSQGAPQCSEEESPVAEQPGYGDVSLISRTRTLRKAAIMLGSDLPDTSTLNQVRDDDDALRTELRALMQGPNFEAWLKNGANDRLLSRKYLDGMSEAQETLGGTYYEALYERTSEAFDSADAAATACGSDLEADTSECALARAERQRANLIYRETQRALAEEPLELIRHVVTNDLPYREVLTADYRMMNPFTYEVLDGASWQGGYDPLDPTDWRPGQIRRYRVAWGVSLQARTGRDYLPSAGILSSPVFLARFPSTETNRNRARARWTYQFFLGVDIERLAVRAMDPEELQQVTNPGAEGSSCFGCHSLLDPVAATFQSWGNDGHFLDRQGYDALPPSYVSSEHYQANDQWYRQQLPAGFNQQTMPTLSSFGPVNGHDDGLRWLADQIVEDDRFATGTVQFWFKGLLGREPLLQPLEPDDPNYNADLEAWQAEQALIAELGQQFRDNDENLKSLLVEMMMSPLFRSERFDQASASRREALRELGIGQLLTPEQLDRKLTAVLGQSWQLDWQQRGQLLENYYLFYGGIDSDGITERPQFLNSMMVSVTERMANELACERVFQEFWPGMPRTLFPMVEITTDPSTEAGETAIRNNLQHLMWRLWGAAEPAEVDAAWELYKALYEQRLSWDEPTPYLSQVAAWSGADANPEEDEYCPVRDLDPNDGIAIALNWGGITTSDWVAANNGNPEPVRTHLGSFYNPEQTLRPWVGVLVYLLTDIQFLTE